ncbi:MAG: hypothetical protein ABFD89_00680 [Bryobacteraceae bacterium]
MIEVKLDFAGGPSERDKSLVKHLAEIAGPTLVDSFDPLNRIDQAMGVWQLVASGTICLSLWIIGFSASVVTNMETKEQFTANDPARAICEAVARATGWQEPRKGEQGGGE